MKTKKPSETFNPDPIFNFDFENRMIGHTTSAGNAYDYKYDGLGNRLRKHSSTATTRYIFDTSGPLSRLMAISGDQNYATTFWIYGLGLIYDTDGKYYLEDGSGNTRFTANSSGSKSTSANYDTFGNIRSSSGILPDFQFNKQQNDNESNLYFLRARYYDPTIGRFISKDPVKGALTLPQSQNPYAYALNNPINLSDPSGLWYIDVGGSTGIIGPLGAGAGVQINDQGITPYISVGTVTPGKGITATYSPDDPQQNSTTVNYAVSLIAAGSVSYPYASGPVPVLSGEFTYGVGFPFGASVTVNRTFSTLCW